MSGFELVAIVMGMFFVSGVALGVMLVFALPALRGICRSRSRSDRDYRGYLDDGAWLGPPRRDDGEKPPWWQDG